MPASCTTDTEALQLTFSTNEVQIEGQNLRDLVFDIQDFAIKWLRTAPEKYGAVTPIWEGAITSIRVMSVEGKTIGGKPLKKPGGFCGFEKVLQWKCCSRKKINPADSA